MKSSDASDAVPNYYFYLKFTILITTDYLTFKVVIQRVFTHFCNDFYFLHEVKFRFKNTNVTGIKLE